jgi:MFS family permease
MPVLVICTLCMSVYHATYVRKFLIDTDSQQERGKHMAFTNVALFGGSFLTPVTVGQITASLGWQWSFYFVSIFTAAALPFVVFFVPETAFRRAKHLNTDFAGKAHRSRQEHGVSQADATHSNIRTLDGSDDEEHLSVPGKRKHIRHKITHALFILENA